MRYGVTTERKKNIIMVYLLMILSLLSLTKSSLKNLLKKTLDYSIKKRK